MVGDPSPISHAAHKANLVRVASVCSVGKGSVPRGRVYANYASRCATEKITVLNPASFGKLVRVLFPGLKTRRLGVRGESKYHYVNFHMEDEEAEELDTRGSSTQTPTITEMGISAQDNRYYRWIVDTICYGSLTSLQSRFHAASP